MLVLARGPGQSVVLDDRITVTVLPSRPGIVRLGIDAPEGVGVRRGELEVHDPAARRPRAPRRAPADPDLPAAGEPGTEPPA
jgi:carbon storage regulator CsrA